jgi:hypothetical protein
MIMGPEGLGPKNDCAGKARDMSSRQRRGPHKQTQKCLTVTKIRSWASDGA